MRVSTGQPVFSCFPGLRSDCSLVIVHPPGRQKHQVYVRCILNSKRNDLGLGTKKICLIYTSKNTRSAHITTSVSLAIPRQLY